MSKLEPASGIITTLGGPGQVAAALGIDRSAVWRWTQPRSKKGTNGVVPHWYVPKLLDLAREKNKDLTPASFAPVIAPAAAHSEAAA